MATLALIASSLAGLAWLSAAVHAFLLVPHRHPELTVGQLVLGGYRFFNAETFVETGKKLHRRFMGSALAFAGCVVLLMVVSVLSA